MNGTTIERCKRLMDGRGDDTKGDAYLASLIGSVSAHAEKFLRRSLGTEERTITLDWRCGRRRIMLPAYPVTVAPVVRHDTWRQWGDDTIVNDSLYAVDETDGRIVFDYWLPPEGFQVLRVTWTGGMGTTPEALAVAFPDVSQAIAMQVVHEFRRRGSLDLGSVTAGGEVVGFSGDVRLLRHVEDMLQPHRREGLLT